ncbi:MAG: CHASE2 domain-containing protein, partial [Ruminococcus sp.]|nr:CHASE2 domain-containing protein [Ruminococcus sp.]
MKAKKPIKKSSLLVQTAETVLVMLAAFAICYFNVFSKFEKLLTDRVYQSPRGINNKIKIISIDNRTLRELGTMGTWSRQVYADVINSLGDYPDVIVMDLMITGSMDEAGDKALNEACAKHKNVIAGSYINYNSVLRKGNDGNMYVDQYNIETVDQPIMQENCETGFVNAQPDSDGVLRSSLLTSMYQGRKLDSISYKAYRMYCEKNGTTPYEPTLENGRMNITYAGKPGNYENI